MAATVSRKIEDTARGRLSAGVTRKGGKALSPEERANLDAFLGAGEFKPRGGQLSFHGVKILAAAVLSGQCKPDAPGWDAVRRKYAEAGRLPKLHTLGKLSDKRARRVVKISQQVRRKLKARCPHHATTNKFFERFVRNSVLCCIK